MTPTCPDDLGPGDLIQPNFDISIWMEIRSAWVVEGQDAFFDVKRDTLLVGTNDGLVVVGIERLAVDRWCITCFAKGRPCQVVMDRHNVVRTFRLISRHDDEV